MAKMTATRRGFLSIWAGAPLLVGIHGEALGFVSQLPPTPSPALSEGLSLRFVRQWNPQDNFVTRLDVLFGFGNVTPEYAHTGWRSAHKRYRIPDETGHPRTKAWWAARPIPKIETRFDPRRLP